MPETRQSDLRNLAWMDKEGPNMASVVLPTPLGTQSTLVLRSMQQTQSRGPLQSGCSKKKYLHAWRRWLCGFAQARFSAKRKEPVVERWTQVTVTLLLPSPALEEPLPALLPWESLGSYWHIEGSEEACSRPAALKLAIVGWLVLCGTSVLALRLGLRRTQPLNTFHGLRNQRGKPLLS